MSQHARPVALAVALVVLVATAGTASASAIAGGHSSAGPAEPTTPPTANATGETTITVSATGQVAAEPDRAVVLLASTAVADDPANATARLAANVSTLRSALLAANLAAEQFRTTDYDVFQQPRDDRPVDRPGGEPVRYVARQGFEVTLDDVNRTGEIIDVAVENGATEVRGVSFALADATRQDLRADALGEAMTDARRQADAIAAAANLTVVRLGSASSAGQEFVPVRTAAFEEADVAAGTRIDSGPVTVSATVRVTYVAEDAGDAQTADAGSNGNAES